MPKPSVKQSITLVKTKDCKSCVRFDAPEGTKNPVIGNAYVARPFADNRDSITITIE